MERFWASVDKTDGCWLWTALADEHGYGLRHWQGRRQKAHRISWQLANGPIPDGLHVLHHCDTPGCVNPGHLYLGTHADNMRDMAARGRAVGGPGAKHGEAHHMAVLTEEIVVQARQRVAGGGKVSQLAAEYGVNYTTLYHAVSGRTWRTVGS